MNLQVKVQDGGPDDGGVKRLILTATTSDEMEMLSVLYTSFKTGKGATVKPKSYVDKRTKGPTE